MTGHGLLDCGVGDGDCPSADSGRRVVGTCTYSTCRSASATSRVTRFIDKGVFTRVIVAAHCSARVREGCVVGKSSASGTVYLVGVGQTTEAISSNRLRHHGHGVFKRARFFHKFALLHGLTEKKIF